MALLEARDVFVDIPTEDGVVHAVQGISFTVGQGEMFGIVGESGSGKSVLTQAIMGLLPSADISGSVRFDGTDLLALSPTQLRAVRGKDIGMIFQDPLSSLHPYFTIGSQIAEVIQLHERVSPKAARDRVVRMLERVGVPRAAERYNDYPHQFSGGMRQRVMIAMALILHPKLVIADEPTTALDVTVQAQVIDLLDELRREMSTAIIMISHDLTLLGSVADRAMVMYGGHQLETGPIASVFGRPAHPYTAGLLRSSPTNGADGRLIPIHGRPPSLLRVQRGCVFAERCPDVQDICRSAPPPRQTYSDGITVECVLERPPSEPIAVPVEAVIGAMDADELGAGTETRTMVAPMIRVSDLHLSFGTGAKRREVLQGIDLTLASGQTLGLVGESGCGKTTLARVIAGLLPATSGDVELKGQSLAELTPRQWHAMRRTVQVVFQDPHGSLNPRRRVGAVIGDPLRIHRVGTKAERKERVRELMELVGLNPEHYNRFPAEFSGGQRQRIGIARALALNPSVIIFDEPVSALDVSIQAQILNLMKDLQDNYGFTYLFISHDLAVVRHVCDTIAVMQDGKIVEFAPTARIYDDPQHPFTRQLLAASIRETPDPVTKDRRVVAVDEMAVAS
jgi:peptide/nickel transport system ATP-binding protein